MSYKKFEIQFVTIKNSRIDIPIYFKQFFEKFEYVDFYWDNEIKSIGIKPVNVKSYPFLTCSFKITKNGDRLVFHLRRFAKYYNLDFKKSKHYPAKWNKQKRLLEIYLEVTKHEK